MFLDKEELCWGLGSRWNVNHRVWCYRIQCLLMVVGLFSLTVVSAYAQTVPVQFDPFAAYSLSGQGPRGIASADFNGDGIIDLVSSTAVGDSKINLNYGDGFGGFAAGDPFPILLNTFAVAAFLDDGDSFADFVVAGTQGLNTSPLVAVFHGDGLGNFTSPYSFTAQGTPGAIVVADFDGDGTDDLAVGDSSNKGPISLFLSAGGSLQNAVETLVTTSDVGSGHKALVAVDLDRDGDKDLVSPIGVFFNDGSGIFTRLLNITISTPNAISVATADFNTDGRPDLVFANASDIQVVVQNADGSFTTVLLATVGVDMQDVEAVDVNVDGFADIVAVDFSNDQIYLLAGLGNATFDTIQNYSTGRGPRATIMGDWTGDGFSDLAALVEFTPDFGGTFKDQPELNIFLQVPSTANVPPVANLDTVSTQEDTDLTIPVLLNDTDADNDTLTITQVGSVNNGSVVVNPDDTLTYTPDLDTNGLEIFSYQTSDGTNIVTGEVRVDVAPVNDAPVLNKPGPRTVTEGATKILPLSANDADVGDTITISAVNLPAFATIVDNGDGTGLITISPGINDQGTYVVTVNATDTIQAQDSKNFLITVVDNTMPVAFNDNAITAEDTSSNIAVLSNDTDADGDSLTVTSVTQALNGSVSINGNGTLQYIPVTNYNGPDSFSYSISDGKGGSATAIVSVSVTAVNDPPVLNRIGPRNVDEGATKIAVLQASDPDAGDSLTFTAVNLPSFATLTDNGDGTGVITISPGAPHEGFYVVTVIVSDGAAAQDSKKSGMTVNDMLALVPNVSGNSQLSGEAAIVSSGLLVGIVSAQNSEAVPAGDIISQIPVGGVSVVLGSAVDLVISDGPAPVLVPDVTGLGQAVATADITNAGLVVGTISTQSSATVPAGDVISQTPAGGVSVAPGNAVELTVSSGSGSILVPDVVGLSEVMAADVIISSGLTVGTVTFQNNAAPDGEVIGQTPADGISVASGSSVNLLVSAGPGEGGFSIEKIEWKDENSELFGKGEGLQIGDQIDFYNAVTNGFLGSTLVNNDWDWEINLVLTPAASPCNIRIESRGMSLTQPVSNAATNCLGM